MKTISISKIKYVVLVAIALMAFSCNPEEGPIGPMGLQGEQGLQGPQGEKGESGQDGEDGADGQDGRDGTDGEDGRDATVYSSGWFPSEFPNDPFSSASFTKQDSNITQDIIDFGLILVYGKVFNNDVRLLPQSQTSSKYYTYNIPDTSTDGEIDFEAYTLDGSRQLFVAFDDFRYVLIPANANTGKSTKQSVRKELEAAGVDMKDYYAVCDYYGLEY